mgnify:CR=1 FL=1
MNPTGLFIIGALAGLTSALFPRVSGALAAGGDVTAFSAQVLGLAVAFGAMVGVVVMFIEWDERKSPRDIFFTALGIPALLAGSLNTADGLRTAVDAKEREQKAVETVRKAADIPVVTPATPAQPPPAGPTSQRDTGFRLAFVIQEDRFYVVLGPFDTATAASETGAQSGIQNVISQDGRFYVVLEPPQPKADAVAAAVRWRDRGLPAALLEAHKESST